MNNTIKTIILSSTLVAASTVSAEIETAVHAGYHSIYEFRGVNFGDNLSTTGIDASKEIATDLTFSAGAWYGSTNGNRGNTATDELDLYFAFTKSFENFDLSVGYTKYLFLQDGGSGNNSSEWFVGASREFSNGVELSLTYYRDIDIFEGAYIEAQVSKSYELKDDVGLDLSAGISYSDGYNSDLNGNSLNGLNSYFVSVSTPWDLGKGFVLTPYVKFLVADSELANDNGESNNLLIGGVSLSYAF